MEIFIDFLVIILLYIIFNFRLGKKNLNFKVEIEFFKNIYIFEINCRVM